MRVMGVCDSGVCVDEGDGRVRFHASSPTACMTWKTHSNLTHDGQTAWMADPLVWLSSVMITLGPSKPLP